MGIIMQCSNLSKKYGKHTALDQLSLTIESGRIVGLLGPNGSGKTTLIKMACGMLYPNGGSISINGMEPCAETKKVVSYLPDVEYIQKWMKINSMLDLYEAFFADFDRKKAEDMLESLGLSPKDNFRKLSKGNREKVQLVLAMSRRARLYLLDEPIGGVDPAARDYILNTIINNYSEDAAVVISTHLIADVEQVLDEAVFIKDGNIIFHRAVDEIRENEGQSVDQLFREVFKCWKN